MKTVLLVEDSKILQMVSQRSLTKAGYQVLLAEDGEKALSIAQSNLLDVIVLDMMLPNQMRLSFRCEAMNKASVHRSSFLETDPLRWLLIYMKILLPAWVPDKQKL